MPTKAEMLEELDSLDFQIDELREKETPEVPGHDLYRAVLFGYCMDCGQRYCDWAPGETCQQCQDVTKWLQEWEETYRK